MRAARPVNLSSRRWTAILTAALLGLSAALSAALPAEADVDGEAFFANDEDTLAIFEFNGDVLDSSGNGRHATLLNAESAYQGSAHGQALVLPGTYHDQGIEWNAYKHLLEGGFTVEVLLQSDDVQSYRRLFTHDADSDEGLYFYDGGYPGVYLGPPLGTSITEGQLFCLAWVAPDSEDGVLEIYLDGGYVGQLARQYAEPSVAWFFNDDGSENLEGQVDAMRISSVARSAAEIDVACHGAEDTPPSLNARTPTISGTAKVGSKLTAKATGWGPTGVTLSYQWYRGQTRIAKATKATYTLVGADAGKKISVRVSGKLAGYATKTVSSSATKPVAKGTLTSKTPKITGTAKVGKKLTAKPGTWGPKAAKAKLSYQWYRGKAKIKGATKSSYGLKGSDKGKRISVRVTGKATGYATVTKASAARTIK